MAGWRRDAKDVMYVERVHGRFEAWTYSEGRKVALRGVPRSSKPAISGWASRNGYRVIWVDC